jgi:formylglycine-generating enzyme required for sulfatase activity
MVTIPLPNGGSFCIDSTEVTNADYQAFLDANVPLSEQPEYCSWNDSYSVAIPPPPGSDLLPVVFVDWCDAYVYCAWAGKRLCGKIGGGSLEPDDLLDPMKSQWTYACTQGGLKTYPYGDTYGPKTCVTFDPDNSDAGVSAVGSHPDCVGGFPGIFDMSGNAVEFEDNASETTGENDVLVLRGGGFGSIDTGATCLAKLDVPRTGDLNGSGFRCCKD